MIKENPVDEAQKQINESHNNHMTEGYMRENGKTPAELDPNTPMLHNIAYNLAVLASVAVSVNDTLMAIHKEMVAARVTAESKDDKTKRTYIGQKPA